MVICVRFFLFQADDGIRGFWLSRGLGNVYKRQVCVCECVCLCVCVCVCTSMRGEAGERGRQVEGEGGLLYTSDAADDRLRLDPSGRRITNSN